MPPKLQPAVDYHNAQRMREDATREVVDQADQIEGSSPWEDGEMTFEERINDMHNTISGLIKTIRDSRGVFINESFESRDQTRA